MDLKSRMNVVQAKMNGTVAALTYGYMAHMNNAGANINYTMTDDDVKKIEDLIDAICDASKILNNSANKDAALKEAKAKIKKLEASK